MNLFGDERFSGGDRVRAITPARSPVATLRGIFVWRGKNMYCPEGSATGRMIVYRVPLAGVLRKATGVFERNRSPMGRQVAGPRSADRRDSWHISAQRTGTGGPDGTRRVLPMRHFSGTHFLGWIYFPVAPDNLCLLLAEVKATPAW
jgi:hypothetical protein